jgi:ribosomal protein S18 acetylase RimI-like enzyme
MFTLKFKEAIESDIAALAAIRAAEWETDAFWHNRISGYMSGEHHPQKALEPRIVYIAEENNNVSGFIAGHLTQRYECDGEIQWLNVTPENKRSGLASKLIELLASWFIQQSACRICVNVDPENTAARNFYKHHGAADLNKYWLLWEDISIVLNRT